MRREDDSAPRHLKLHEEYLPLYKIAHNNAGVLLSEAEILLERGKYIRAFFLGLTALEEIAKSQLAADVFTGFPVRRNFRITTAVTQRRSAGWLGPPKRHSTT